MLDKWWSSSQRRINFKYHYGVSRASLYIDYGLFPCDKSGKKSYLIKKTRRQPLVKGYRPVKLRNSIVIYASFPRRVTIITMTSCPLTRTITRSRAEFVIFFSTLTVTFITKYVLVSILFYSSIFTARIRKGFIEEWSISFTSFIVRKSADLIKLFSLYRIARWRHY